MEELPPLAVRRRRASSSNWRTSTVCALALDGAARVVLLVAVNSLLRQVRTRSGYSHRHRHGPPGLGAGTHAPLLGNQNVMPL